MLALVYINLGWFNYIANGIVKNIVHSSKLLQRMYIVHHQFIPIKIIESHQYKPSFIFPHFSTRIIDSRLITYRLSIFIFT